MSFFITPAFPALPNAEIVLIIRAGVLTFSDPPDSPPWPCFAHACLRRIIRPPVGFKLYGPHSVCFLFLGRSGVNLWPILTGLGIRCAPVAFGGPLALHDVQSGLAIRVGFVVRVSLIHDIGRRGWSWWSIDMIAAQAQEFGFWLVFVLWVWLGYGNALKTAQNGVFGLMESDGL